MGSYADASAELLQSLENSFRQGPIVDDKGRRSLTEKVIDRIPSLGIKIVMYPREHEPPHFMVEFQNESCRFDLGSGEPLDRVPQKINKYLYNIKAHYKEKRQKYIDEYNALRPSDAPPQTIFRG